MRQVEVISDITVLESIVKYFSLLFKFKSDLRKASISVNSMLKTYMNFVEAEAYIIGRCAQLNCCRRYCIGSLNPLKK